MEMRGCGFFLLVTGFFFFFPAPPVCTTASALRSVCSFLLTFEYRSWDMIIIVIIIISLFFTDIVKNAYVSVAVILTV